MPNINLRLSDEEHEALRKWAYEGRRSIQREIIFRLFAEGATITGERRTAIPDTDGAAASPDDKAAPTGKGQEARATTPSVPSEDEHRPPRPKNYRSEPFSLVCSNRANHEPGVYCPECKGDGGR